MIWRNYETPFIAIGHWLNIIIVWGYCVQFGAGTDDTGAAGTAAGSTSSGGGSAGTASSTTACGSRNAGAGGSSGSGSDCNSSARVPVANKARSRRGTYHRSTDDGR